MPGYNFQTYIDKFNEHLRWGSKLSLPFHETPTVLSSLLTEAFRFIQLHKNVAALDTTISLTASTYAHALPSTVMGWKIDAVEVEGSSSTDKTRLEHKTIDFIRSNYDLNDTSSTGTPIYWAVSDSAQRSIILAPAPSYSKSGGVHIYGTIQSAPLWRRYQSDAVDDYTASITYNTTSVTISNGGPITAGQIVDGDEFGVVRTTDDTGRTQTNISPIKWYRITTASGTTLTLTNTFDEPSASSLKFVTAQVHPIEIAMPGVLGFVPVKLALAEWLKHTDRDRAFGYQQEALADLMAIPVEKRGVKVPLQNIRDNVAWVSS